MDEVVPLDSVYESGRVALCLRLENGEDLDEERIERALKIARAHPGRAPVQVQLTNGGDEPSRLRSRALRVKPEPDVVSELRSLLDRDRVQLVQVKGE